MKQLSRLFVLILVAGSLLTVGSLRSSAQTPACSGITFPFQMTNRTQIVPVINCFNTLTTPGAYTINLVGAFGLNSNSFPPQINNSTPGVRLVLNGVGSPSGFTFSDFQRYLDIAANTTVDIVNLTFANGISSNGALIRNSGTLTVQGSTFVNNDGATDGGAIQSSGVLLVSNSTFSGNTGDQGGAIYNTGSATIRSSTFSDNTSLAAGGAVNNKGTLTLVNSIVANSITGSDCVDTGTLTYLGNNLIEDGSCNASGNSQLTGDPLLAALANNGGVAQTHLLQAGSAALNAGDNTYLSESGFPTAVDFDGDGLTTTGILSNDQRGAGFTRVRANPVDLGAVEASVCTTGFPTTVINAAALNDAIACYNTQTVAGTYTINIGASIALSAATVQINNTNAGVQLAINGNNETIDGANAHRLFDVASNTRVDFANLMLVNGAASTGADAANNIGGAAIVNRGGTVTVRASSLSNNSTSTNGGAIYHNGGTMTILESSLSNNRAAANGGAIAHFDGTLTISSSTFSNNQVTASNVGGGGAIVSIAPLVVSNSSFSNNSTDLEGGAIYSVFSSLTVASSTFSGNRSSASSAAISSDSTTLTLSNTIVANSVTGSDCKAIFGPLNLLGVNLIEDGSCNASANGQLTGDPKLGPLANNGGPTETFALLAGSPAINVGDNTYLSEAAFPTPLDFDGDGLTTGSLMTDQRGTGFVRLFADRVDLGAVESDQCLPNFVNTEAELNTAMSCYNSQTTAATYTVSLTGDITLTADTTQINNSTAGAELALLGNGFTLNGADAYQILNIAANTHVYLADLTLSNGRSTSSLGGAVSNLGHLTISGSTFKDNQAPAGGAIYNDNPGVLLVSNSTFSGNGGGFAGGAIATRISNATIVNSTFSNNSASNNGGAIVNDGNGTVVIVNSILANSPSGGDCVNLAGTITLLGVNLIEDGSCGAGSTAGQLTGDPALGPLADNGGPTQTFALQTGSPAINAGDNTYLSESAFTPPIDFNGDGDTADTLLTDQRGAGFPRILTTTVDLGAVEGFVAARGDCNADGLIDAGDIAALNIELSSSGSFDPIGCDTDANGVVDSADLNCARARVFDPTAVCAAP